MAAAASALGGAHRVVAWCQQVAGLAGQDRGPARRPPRPRRRRSSGAAAQARLNTRRSSTSRAPGEAVPARRTAALQSEDQAQGLARPRSPCVSRSASSRSGAGRRRSGGWGWAGPRDRRRAQLQGAPARAKRAGQQAAAALGVGRPQVLAAGRRSPRAAARQQGQRCSGSRTIRCEPGAPRRWTSGQRPARRRARARSAIREPADGGGTLMRARLSRPQGARCWRRRPRARP